MDRNESHPPMGFRSQLKESGSTPTIQPHVSKIVRVHRAVMHAPGWPSNLLEQILFY